MVMLMPGLSASNVPTRIRLSMALAFTLVFYPLVADSFPQMPATPFAALAMLGREMAIGFIIGGIARLLTSAIQVAGAVVAFQSGLAFAQTPDPTMGGQQGALVGNFLAVLSIALIFATDLHHLSLGAIYHSYEMFQPGADFMIEDAAQMAIQTVSASFAIGVQIAAPFVIFGMIFNFGLGILARLMPQVQVFFIAMPANIILGFVLLAILVTAMMAWYMSHLEDHLMLLAT